MPLKNTAPSHFRMMNLCKTSAFASDFASQDALELCKQAVALIVGDVRAEIHEAVGLLKLWPIFNWLGGGFKYFLFSPLFGEDSHFD